MRWWAFALLTLVLLPARARDWSNTVGATASEAAAVATPDSRDKATADVPPPPTRKIWGNMSTLRDHFARHGGDFGAKDPDDYARMAWKFLQRAKADGLPAKVDSDKVLRVFDPKTRTFAAYNADGKAKTFFKPESRDYFERQPGKSVNLKTWK